MKKFFESHLALVIIVACLVLSVLPMVLEICFVMPLEPSIIPESAATPNLANAITYCDVCGEPMGFADPCVFTDAGRHVGIICAEMQAGVDVPEFVEFC